MHSEFLPYVVTEGFCILYTATIFFRLQSEIGDAFELASLKKIIAAYVVMTATDMIWSAARAGLISVGHTLNMADNAVSLAAVVPGCYYWFRFVEYRIKPDRVVGKTAGYLIGAPVVVMCGIDLVSTFTEWVFTIDADGWFQTGKYFWIQGVVTFTYLLIPTFHAVFATFRTSSGEKRREYLTYTAYMLICFAIVAVEDYFPTVPIMELGVFAAIQVLFLTLYLDKEYALSRKERELTESRTAAMLSQIQPHFLYNTLTVIQTMCRDKAPEAAETIVEFSDYLRGNMDSLSRKEPVLFERELRHTQNYLALEKKRFGSRLNVEYDIRVAGFLLPALTLQPIVENAVQHGVSEREEGGTVRIATAETARSFRITVTDDGVGFDPTAVKNDGRAHIGITNVRARLAAVCGGTLAIDSEPGTGTTAVIEIPKEEQLP